jgi:hypothetical protein
MKDNKPDMIFLVFKIILTSVMMFLLALIEPVFAYIWCAAVLIAVPICIAFAFIGRRGEDDGKSD